MNIAICEDDAADAAEIRTILDRYIEQNGYTAGISVFGSGEDLLTAFSPGLYDIIFLDIYMGGITGIETARKIRDVDPGSALVFITSSADHSLESYSVRGSAYVVKPINEKKMDEALVTCRDIFLRNARYITIRTVRSDMKIPLIRIYYVESKSNDALFQTASGGYKTRMTLDEVERRLDDRSFYRCHQSYIVNTNHIRKLDGNDVFMNNGDRIPMRKSGRDAIRAELTDLLSARLFEDY